MEGFAVNPRRESAAVFQVVEGPWMRSTGLQPQIWDMPLGSGDFLEVRVVGRLWRRFLVCRPWRMGWSNNHQHLMMDDCLLLIFKNLFSWKCSVYGAPNHLGSSYITITPTCTRSLQIITFIQERGIFFRMFVNCIKKPNKVSDLLLGARSAFGSAVGLMSVGTWFHKIKFGNVLRFFPAGPRSVRLAGYCQT